MATHRRIGSTLCTMIALFIPQLGQASPGQCTNQPDIHQAVTSIFAGWKPDANLTPTQNYVRKLFLALTGASKPTYDPHFNKVVQLITKQPVEAVKTITNDSDFYTVRVRAFAIPFIDPDPVHRPKDTLTDLQALIIGVTRDELDARLLLTGNLRYSGYQSLGLPAPSRANNDHYVQFEAQQKDFITDLERVDKQWEDLDYVSGAFTTRGWAAAYYKAGTNRLAVKFALEEFLCTPIDTWKIAGLPDAFVRRDVTREDGGNPSNFQITCRHCHGAMDAMGGAFAKLDFTDAGFIFQKDGVVKKMNQHETVYTAGNVSTDDSWVNLLSNHPTIDFGWRDDFQGVGLASFAKSLADSKAFSQCMVQRVFSSVCGQTIQIADLDRLAPMADAFEKDNYNIKNLFVNVALEDKCISHPQSEAL